MATSAGSRTVLSKVNGRVAQDWLDCAFDHEARAESAPKEKGSRIIAYFIDISPPVERRRILVLVLFVTNFRVGGFWANFGFLQPFLLTDFRTSPGGPMTLQILSAGCGCCFCRITGVKQGSVPHNHIFYRKITFSDAKHMSRFLGERCERSTK